MSVKRPFRWAKSWAKSETVAQIFGPLGVFGTFLKIFCVTNVTNVTLWAKKVGQWAKSEIEILGFGPGFSLVYQRFLDFGPYLKLFF